MIYGRSSEIVLQQQEYVMTTTDSLRRHVLKFYWANLLNLRVPPDWMDLARNIRIETSNQHFELLNHKSPVATLVNGVKNAMS
jgi:hypothetical protein